MVVTKKVQLEMAWWRANIMIGRSFKMPIPKMTITADASHQCWGAHMGALKVRWLWGPMKDDKHINWLELKNFWH